MDYVKSSDWELGMVIEHHKRVEGMEIGVGTGSNNTLPTSSSDDSIGD